MEESQSIEAFATLTIGALVFLAFVVRCMFEQVNVPALVGYIGLGVATSALDGQWGLLGENGRTVLEVLGSIGIVALLFRVGVESDLPGLLSKLRQAVPIWLGSVVIAGVAAFGASYLLLGLDWLNSLFIGVASTATSVGVSVSTWQDHKALRTENGERLLDVAEMDDISGVALLALLIALVPVLQDPGGRTIMPALGSAAGIFALKLAGFSLFCFLLGNFVERPVVTFWQRRLSKTDLTILVAAIGIMIAATAEWLGLSIAIGALFAGFIFSGDTKRVEEDRAYQAFLDLFAPFFFISIGMSFEFGVASQALTLALPLFVALVLGKFVGTALPAVATAGWTGAVLIGVSMVPRAEIAMIVMERGRQGGFVSDAAFGSILIVSIATCTLAPITLHRLFKRWPQRS